MGELACSLMILYPSGASIGGPHGYSLVYFFNSQSPCSHGCWSAHNFNERLLHLMNIFRFVIMIFIANKVHGVPIPSPIHTPSHFGFID